MFEYFKFAVKIVRLNVSITIASPMTLIFIQGHKYVSNSTTFNLQYLGQYLNSNKIKLCMTADLFMAFFII